MEDKNYCYKYPHPCVAVDGVVFGFDGLKLNVLLIKRGQERHVGEWALPGGFLHEDETAEDGVRREVEEETGLVDNFTKQFGVYTDPKRDFSDGARVISIAFFTLVKNQEVKGGDDAKHAEWFALDKVPSLAFDHEKILRDAQKVLREKIHFEPIGFDLLPEKFTMKELQALYEAILEVKFDRSNFAKKMTSLNILTMLDETVWPTPKREAHLYTFNKDSYEEMKQKGFRLEF